MPDLSLTSLSYVLFVLVGIFLVYLVKRKYQWIVLLILSGVFFLSVSGAGTLGWLFLDAATAFLGARFLKRTDRQGRKKAIVTVTVILLIAELLLLKYIPDLPLLAPIAISFYTLSILSYVLDVYWGIQEAETNFARFLLYAAYFPQMTSGPVNRYRKLAPQFREGSAFSYERIRRGLLRISFGILKKCLIADQIANIVNPIFADPKSYQGVSILIGAMAFALQLYTDFSGCMDIILGTSVCFGIELDENFEIPFSSQTMSEFWRRWHITLGVWFKEYLLYPLLKSAPLQRLSKACIKKYGRKKGKVLPTYVGLLVVWFLIGYWHGGALHYVIGSGLLHYFYIVSGELLEPHMQKLTDRLHINRSAGWYVLLRRLKVFLLVCSGFVFFRAAKSRDALYMYKCLILPEGNFFSIPIEGIMLSADTWALMLIAFALMLLVSILKEKGKNPYELLEKRPAVIRWLFYFALVALLLLSQIRGFGVDAASFIYNKF